MEIKLTNCKVIVHDFVTHKAEREYQNALIGDFAFGASEAAKVKTKIGDETSEDLAGEMNFKLNHKSVEAAGEAFALAMIKKVIPNEGEPFAPSMEWLDELPQTDFKTINKTLRDMKRASSQKVKNEQGESETSSSEAAAAPSPSNT